MAQCTSIFELPASNLGHATKKPNATKQSIVRTCRKVAASCGNIPKQTSAAAQLRACSRGSPSAGASFVCASATAQDAVAQDASAAPSNSAIAPILRALTVAVVAWFGMAMASHAAAAGSAGSSVPARIFHFIMHLDSHLTDLIAQHGTRGVYGVLFGIVFAETGLVITPFLPGDSLLFAAGCLRQLNFWALLVTFITAASLGDAFNYTIGSYLGKKAVRSNFVKTDYVEKTEKFYSKYGVKTIVLARFVPIVRTFAPFVAGIASMDYKVFAAYNVGGAVLWSVLLTGVVLAGLGRAFGQLPVVQNNFSAVCGAIVVVSLVPVVVEWWIARKESRTTPPDSPAAGTTGD